MPSQNRAGRCSAPLSGGRAVVTDCLGVAHPTASPRYRVRP